MEWLLLALSLNGAPIYLCPADRQEDCIYSDLKSCLKKAEQFNHAISLADAKLDLQCRQIQRPSTS